MNKRLKQPTRSTCLFVLAERCFIVLRNKLLLYKQKSKPVNSAYMFDCPLERCFIVFRSNNQADQKTRRRNWRGRGQRRGLERERLEREGQKGFRFQKHLHRFHSATCTCSCIIELRKVTTLPKEGFFADFLFVSLRHIYTVYTVGQYNISLWVTYLYFTCFYFSGS